MRPWHLETLSSGNIRQQGLPRQACGQGQKKNEVNCLVDPFRGRSSTCNSLKELFISCPPFDLAGTAAGDITCFKMTMGSPNIMTFWHNMLHDITGWMQKKLELMNRNWQVDNFSKFIKGKHGFYNKGKTEKFEIPFLARKIDQYWIRIYQKVRNSNIWGGMFSNKSRFCQQFHEKIWVLDFWGYNGA